MNDILNPHACEKSSRHPEQGLRTISDLFVGQDKISLAEDCMVHTMSGSVVDSRSSGSFSSNDACRLASVWGGPGSEDGARECCRCSLRFATYLTTREL